MWIIDRIKSWWITGFIIAGVISMWTIYHRRQGALKEREKIQDADKQEARRIRDDFTRTVNDDERLREYADRGYRDRP